MAHFPTKHTYTIDRCNEEVFLLMADKINSWWAGMALTRFLSSVLQEYKETSACFYAVICIRYFCNGSHYESFKSGLDIVVDKNVL